MREALDAKVLHDLFDLLLEVQHFGLEFCSLFSRARVFFREQMWVVKERERREREARQRLRRRLVSEICSRGKRDDDEEDKEERTMETSFVVSAAFWAPVATESQNDMAFFVAINVETEMVAFARVLSDFARRNNEEGRPRGRGGAT